MQETVIRLNAAHPVDLFGINNTNINAIALHFPRLKILTQGTDLIARGDKIELDNFTLRMHFIIEYFNNYNQLTLKDIESILTQSVEEVVKAKVKKQEVLVYGSGGKIIQAKTKSQRLLVDAVNDTDMAFAIGSAGTGKTYIAVALAVRALKAMQVRRIILTRPAVEAGEKLGFLPGDVNEKLAPYLMPLYDALHDMISPEKLADYIEKEIIQIIPLAFMRGRTLDNCFVIIDEAQNTTVNQMKMFLTRMGVSAKFLITGDVSQIDLPKTQQSGLKHALEMLKGIAGISCIEFDESEVIRHPLVRKIIKAYKSKDEQ